MGKRKIKINRRAVFSGALTTYEHILYETEADYVTIHKLKSGETGVVINIKIPKLQKILIRSEIDALAIRLADKDNNDIQWNTKIKIIKEKRNGEEIVIDELIYSKINAQKTEAKNDNILIINKKYEEYYRFKKYVNIYISRGEHLKICVISPDRDIETINLLLDVNIGIF